jgi:hypothetical protein
MAASLWFYVERVLIPYQEADAVAHGRPRGILSDLYPRWVGTRQLLLHHRDPYSAEVTRQIQAGYYGRELDPNRTEDPKDEQRFVYPVYVAFVLAPLAVVPFAAARLAAEWILGLLTAISVMLWLRTLRWHPSVLTTVVVLLLTLNSFPTVQGIKLEQLSLLVGALLAIGATALASGHLFLAGVMLALATIKPQLAILPVAWLALWALSNWRERQAFFWGLAVSMALLIGGGEFLLPGWIGRFTAGLAAYERYTGGHSLLDELATRAGGTLLTILAIAGMAIICWRARHAPPDSPTFHHVLALVLAVTVLVVPMTAPYNQILLLPAIFLVVRSWEHLWRRSRLSRAVCGLAALIVSWPWLASLALAVAALALPATSVQRAWAVPLWTSLGVPLVVLPLLGAVVADTL